LSFRVEGISLHKGETVGARDLEQAWRRRAREALRPPAARVALMLLAAAAVVYASPRWETSQTSLRFVTPPTAEPPQPHPVAQLAQLEPGTLGAFVSPFIDLGGASCLRGVRSSLPGRIALRSASKTRSFAIARPAPADADALTWHIVPAAPHSARRHVQFALPLVHVGPDLEQQVTVTFEHTRRRSSLAMLLAGLAALGLFGRSLPPLMRRLAPRAVVPVVLSALCALNLALMWRTPVINGDEFYLHELTTDVLDKQTYRVHGFTYPHIQAYLHAYATVAHGVLRPLAGLAYHDPYTNQHYYDGGPIRRRTFTPDFYPQQCYLTVRPLLRRAYALIPLISILLAYHIGTRAASTRAGLLAAVAVSVQPILMRAEILPNTPSALLALVTVALLLRSARGGPAAARLGFVTGLTTAFKYNPVFAPITAGFILADQPRDRRLPAFVVGCAAMVAGFWLCFPTLPLSLRDFMGNIASDAYHYSQAGHVNYEADSSLPFALWATFFRPSYPGNLFILATASLGAAFLSARFARGDRRPALALLLPLALTLAYLLRQFVQFGRNYMAAVALLCILAGIGCDGVLRLAAERWPGRRSLLSIIGTAVCAAAILSVGVKMWGDVIRGLHAPTAREQAIAWVDSQLPLGSRVALVEPLTVQVIGTLPDQRRFRVRVFDSFPDEGPFDYVVISNQLQRPPAEGISARFKGQGVWAAMSEEYIVRKAASTHASSEGDDTSEPLRKPQ
jgi:hypothetical protein